MKFLKNIFLYWGDLYAEIRTWYIFMRTSKDNVDKLNKENQLRVDWIGRVYGVVNLPEEVQGAAQQVQEAYVLQKITDYGNVMLEIGLADVVYPEISRVSQSSYLVVLWPVFESFNIFKIIGNLIKTSLFIFTVIVLIAAMLNHKEYMIEWFIMTKDMIVSLF